MLEFLKKSLPILVVAALVLSGTTAVADIITGLEVHYTFGNAGNLAANAGSGGDGAVVADGAGTLTQVAGPGGSITNAADFGSAAQDRHIDVNGAKSNIGDGSYTFSAWFKTDNVDDTERMSIINGRDASQPWLPEFDYWSYDYSDEVALELGGNWANGPGKLADALSEDEEGGYAWLAPNPPSNLADGDWHHMVSTWEGSTDTLKLFVDGVYLDSTSNGAVGTLDITEYLVGRRTHDDPNNAFIYQGQLADIRMYNWALGEGGVGYGETAGGDIAELHAVGVPEPSSIMLAALGLLSLAFAAWRRRGK